MKKTLISLCIIGAITVLTIQSAQAQTTYDLRRFNRVTPIKSQSGGTCWTHGTMAALESNLLTTGAWDHAGYTVIPNLAEYHLDWWNGFNQHNNDDINPTTGDGLTVHQGGDYRVVTAYISRGEGVVYSPAANDLTEKDTPWYNTAPDRNDPTYDQFYVRDVDWFIAEPDLSKIDRIKNAIKTHGAIATCYYHGSYMSGNIQYQPPDTTDLPNHSVALIGWDDNKITDAPLPGAWLMKNSWGISSGDAGTYWISYYDKWCCQEPEMGAVSFRNVEPMKYDIVHYHDYHGWRDTLIDNTEPINANEAVNANEAFNAFTAYQEQVITAVSFFTAEDNVNYTVTIYDNFSSGQLLDALTTQSGAIEYTGFHTIDLTNPIKLSQNSDFYVYLNLSHGGLAFDRTSQIPVLLGNGGDPLTVVLSSANPGESYYHDGANWQDLFSFDFEDPTWGIWDQTANFCIKALADTDPLDIELIDTPPAIVSDGSTPGVTIKVTPRLENPIAGTITLHYQFNNNGYQSTIMTSLGDGLYNATFPMVDWKDHVEYYFTAQGDLGALIYLPNNAPTDTYQFIAGKNRIVYANNFESGNGWTTETLGASSGFWQRGIPVNADGWDYDPVADADGSGQCFLTQNASGNTDIDGGTVGLISPLIDMSFGEITIAYDYYFCLNRASDGTDLLVVEIDNNDDNWYQIAIHATDGGQMWRHHAIDMDTITNSGVTLSSNMRLRFKANDADTQSLVEAGIDALSVTSTRITRPGDMDGDNDVDMIDYALFSSHWLTSNCSLCQGADCAGEDGNVNLNDLDIFTKNWLDK